MRRARQLLIRHAALLALAVSVAAQSAPAPEAPLGPAAPAAPAAKGRVGAGELSSLSHNEDRVMVTVGEVSLHASDIFRQLDLAAPGRSAEVIRQMVLTTAAQLDAAREGLDVPAELLDKEVERAIAEQKASFALEVDEKIPLAEYLRLRHGMTPEEHHAEVRRMVLASLLLERAVRLDQRRRGYDLTQIILVADEAAAQEMAVQVREGASFAVLARKHSAHPSAARGGELPGVPPGADVPLVAGRETLQPGEILGPDRLVVTEKTWWRLLRLEDRVPPSDAPWAELRAGIEADLAARPLEGEELAVFEARSMDRYRVTRPARSP